MGNFSKLLVMGGQTCFVFTKTLRIQALSGRSESSTRVFEINNSYQSLSRRLRSRPLEPALPRAGAGPAGRGGAAAYGQRGQPWEGLGRRGDMVRLPVKSAPEKLLLVFLFSCFSESSYAHLSLHLHALLSLEIICLLIIYINENLH